ncbi:MAG: GNAT family N-acetyltransferase [Pseudomonadota bacterium]
MREALTTARLTLRPPVPADGAAHAAMHADPEVMAHFQATLEGDAHAAFMARAQAHRERHGFGFWTVERRSDGAVAGLVGLLVPTFEAPFTPCVEISWRLARPFWGKGYALEAAAACLAFGFEDLALEEIVGFTVPANRRSWRLMEQLWMVRDPADDFDHPNLPTGHPLRRHVLYRRRAAAWRRHSPG